MNKKIVVSLIAIIAVIGIVSFILVSGPSTGEAIKATPSIKLEELSQHNSQSDCWVAYKGKVYDVTSFLPKHPGSSEAIEKYCGTTDFEKAFIAKHGESKVDFFMKITTFEGNLV